MFHMNLQSVSVFELSDPVFIGGGVINVITSSIYIFMFVHVLYKTTVRTKVECVNKCWSLWSPGLTARPDTVCEG